MNTSLPVVLLSILGAVIAVLGLFAGGSVEIMVIGLIAIAVAGVLQVLTMRRS